MIQLDRNALYIVISPRFTLSKTGHFYWNTLGYRDAMQNLGLEHRIFVPNFEGADNFLTQNPTFLKLDIKGPNIFGHDIGSISPLHLARLIEDSIQKLKLAQKIYIISFESSLTLFLSLVYLCNKDKRLRVSLNLLDFSFWQKLLKIKNPLFKRLVKTLKIVTKENADQFHVCANSGTQPKLFSELLGSKVFDFPLISVSINRSEGLRQESGTTDLPRKRLLIFPHTDDLELITEVLNYALSRGEDWNWELDLHFRGLSDYNYVQEMVLNSKIENIILTYGYIDVETYSRKFEMCTAVLIPYEDQLHMHSGSGKAMDSLGYGLPLIALKGTHACAIACRVGACFSIDKVTANEISNAMRLVESSDAVTNRYIYRAKIRENASNSISPEASLRELVATFDSIESISQPKEPISIAELSLLWFLMYTITRLHGVTVKKFRIFTR